MTGRARRGLAAAMLAPHIHDMNAIKAVLTVLALVAGLLWAASSDVVPVPNVLQDWSIAVVGVLGLAVASAFRALAAIGTPLLVLMRVFAVPLALGLVGWFALRELRRSRG